MLNINKYERNQDQLTYSEEGFGGGLVGFIIGLAPIPFYATAMSAAAKVRIQKLQQDIEVISERISKLRNKQIDESVKKGIELPKELKHVDGSDVLKGAVLGTIFGPIYGIFIGSEYQDLNNELNKKIKELSVELEKAGISKHDK